jgi:hypothetical protein
LKKKKLKKLKLKLKNEEDEKKIFDNFLKKKPKKIKKKEIIKFEI